MKTVPLTKGYETIVDDDIADLIEALGWSWFAHVQKSGKVYAYRNTLPDAAGRRTTLILHRWITGASPGLEVDHKDGDGLHNWQDNLRVTIKSNNQANSVTINGVSGCRGVFPHGSGFRAATNYRGRRILLGTFPTAREASAVYEAKRRELFGEFAPSR